MSEQFHEVQKFVREARLVNDLHALSHLLEDSVRAFGFQYFALGHHVNVVSGKYIQIGNYPTAWMEVVRSKNQIAEDPVLLACQTSAAGFMWSELPNLIPLSSRQKRILDEAAKAGLGEGFTVPVHIPGECAGSCSFGVNSSVTINEEVLPAAQYIGCFAFEAARRLAKEKETSISQSRNGIHAPALTQRQRDCLVLVAKGKSDWDAGRLLGISDQTVHEHVEIAKRRYGVSTRMQLVIRALFDNQLSFREIF